MGRITDGAAVPVRRPINRRKAPRTADRVGVLLLFPQRMVREGVELLLRDHPRVKVLDSASSPAELERLAQKTAPDALIVDLDDTGTHETALRETLARLSGIPVVGVTADPLAGRARAAALGPSECYVRTAPSGDLASLAVRAVEGAGSVPLTLDAPARRRDRRLPGRLTVRELEVLQEIAAGKQTDAVAADLGIRPLTVRSHLKSIMTKMGAHSTAEAVSTGFRLGIVPPPTGSGGGPTVVDEPQ